MAELNLQSDHLDLFDPRGLTTLAYVLIVTTMNCRVGVEVRDMTFGDFKHVYNPDGSFAYILYSPDTTKKNKGGELRISFSAKKVIFRKKEIFRGK